MENPFVCDKCNKKYFRISSFEKHREKCKSKTNKITMEELYQCIIELKEKNKLLEERLEKVESNKDSYNTKTIEQLHQLLTKAVAGEDYEAAAKIRDEISKR